MAKNKLAISKAQILAAIPATLTFVCKETGEVLVAEKRTFSTGSVGYYMNGKLNVPTAQHGLLKTQCGGNCIIQGSKEAPDGE